MKDVRPEMTVDSKRKCLAFRPGTLFLLGTSVLLCAVPGRSQQTSAVIPANSVLPESQTAEAFPLAQQADAQQSGHITGTVVDQTGARITGVSVKLLRQSEPSSAEVFSDENGQFFFPNVAPGPFHLSVSSEGLAAQEFSGTMHPGETYVTPRFRLIIATQVTEVRVALSPEQIADAQVKDQEKQRVFG